MKRSETVGKRSGQFSVREGEREREIIETNLVSPSPRSDTFSRLLLLVVVEEPHETAGKKKGKGEGKRRVVRIGGWFDEREEGRERC